MDLQVFEDVKTLRERIKDIEQSSNVVYVAQRCTLKFGECGMLIFRCFTVLKN